MGVDNVDLAAASERGVPVGNTPGVLTEATADLAWALMLSAARRLPEAERAMRGGGWSWEPDFLLGEELSGATLGIVGMGRIGSAVARRAEGFGMEVIHTSRGGGRGVLLDELLERSDFVSLHVPLTAETRGLIGAAELGRMKPTAVLVNTARGPIVDEAALATALEDGTIFAAGIDVYEREPEVHPRLLAAPRTVLLPHLGSASEATRRRMARLACEGAVAILAGERPPNLVTPSR